MVTLVYLDQNKWIDLNRAFHRLPGGERFQPVLERIEYAVSNRTALFPLSSAHFVETAKADDVEHRKRLAYVMVEFSQGWLLASSDYLVTQELHIALAKSFGLPIPKPPDPLGRGVPFAFGKTTRDIVGSEMPEETVRRLEQFSESPVGLAALLSLVNDNQSSANRKQGVLAFEQMANIYAQERETLRNLGRNYSNSVRKRRDAALFTLRFQQRIEHILSLIGKTPDDFLNLGKRGLMQFYGNVPRLDVEIELSTARDEFEQKPVDANDMADIDFLSAAIPYCHVVVTERFWVDLAKRRKLDQKYRTVMLSNLSDLAPYLIS